MPMIQPVLELLFAALLIAWLLAASGTATAAPGAAVAAAAAFSWPTKKVMRPKVTPPSSAEVLFQKTLYCPAGRFAFNGSNIDFVSVLLIAAGPLLTSLPLLVTRMKLPGAGLRLSVNV